MRILITGGAGCLGSNLIERWVPLGDEILVIDNFATGKRAVVPPMDGLTLIEGSIADAALVERAFAAFAPTHVIHAAAAYKDPNDWREDISTNVLGTAHVVDAAKAAGVSRFIYLQTVLCYGRTDVARIPVDHPLQPVTSYGISKVAGEQYLAMSGLDYASFRLASVVAPRLASGPIPTFYMRLKEGKACFCSDATRDFLDIDDFFAAMDLALAEDAPSGVFNVSSGQGRTIRDVYDAVRAHLGLAPDPDVRVVPVGDDDIAVVVPDPSATEAELGWRATTSFEDMMRCILSWYDQHGVNEIYSHLAPPPNAAASR